ncbi:hypothetical protein ACHAXT_006370 [Thalassiosira profunda]
MRAAIPLLRHTRRATPSLFHPLPIRHPRIFATYPCTYRRAPTIHSLQNSTMASSQSTPDEVKAAADAPGATILDVRTEKELQEQQLTTRKFHHLSCHIDDCSELMSRAEELLPDKDAPVIVFCRSGRRAGKAKEVLEQKGYTRVLNAGGLKDLDYL